MDGKMFSSSFLFVKETREPYEIIYIELSNNIFQHVRSRIIILVVTLVYIIYYLN